MDVRITATDILEALRDGEADRKRYEDALHTILAASVNGDYSPMQFRDIARHAAQDALRVGP